MMKKQLLALCVISSWMTSQAQTFTNQSGILNPGSSSGVPIVLDMNQDYLDDVVRISGGDLLIDYQQPDGTFIQQTLPAGIQNNPTWSACAGDLNGDGFNDFFFGSGSNGSFILSNSDGTAYTETVDPSYLFSQRSNIADIDNDGDLDVFACHDVDQNHPYRNDGQGNLIEDQSLLTTVPLAGNYASVFVDYDNDGDTDMHMSKCRLGSSPGDPERMNAMYRNNGDGTWSEVAALIGQDDGDQSWVTIFQDFDNDGDFDSYTVNHYISNRFKVNDGIGNYTEYAAPGIDLTDLNSWSAVGADFDNDGFVDILVESGVGKQFYHNDGNLNFTPSSMPFDDGALCDLNNDGFIDVYTGNNLWINEANGNNWVKFNLEGIVSNSAGIGSRISIYGDWGVQVREVRSGENFRPMSTLNVHFGIGASTEIDSVVVAWPSGTVVTVESPSINTLHVIPEAECLFTSAPISADGDLDICAGESVTLTAEGGYAYEWSDGSTSQSITVSESGNYAVIMTDTNGCFSLSDPVNVNLVGDEFPSVSVSGLTTFCEGESITLTSSEANGYIWSTNENSQSIEVMESGTYAVTTIGICENETSESIQVEVLEAIEPVVSDIAAGSLGIVQVSAVGDNITWYEDAAGTTVLGSGNSIDIDVTSSPTTVYASSVTEYAGIEQTGGKLDDDGGGGIPSTGAYSYFNAYEDFTLDQVTVYVIENILGERNFILYDENDQILESITVDLQTEGAHTIDLGWSIPAGDGMYIACEENNLFRNNSGVQYPYAIGDVGEITTSFYGNQYYYYFYNWQVTKGSESCESELVPVTILITDLEEIAGLRSFTSFPNPADDVLSLIFNLERDLFIEVELINMMGQSVYLERFGLISPGEFRHELNIRDLVPGMYEIKVSADKQVGSYKMVKL